MEERSPQHVLRSELKDGRKFVELGFVQKTNINSYKSTTQSLQQIPRPNPRYSLLLQKQS